MNEWVKDRPSDAQGALRSCGPNPRQVRVSLSLTSYYQGRTMLAFMLSLEPRGAGLLLL